jgi:4-amino-4-deoxy-L-arabinose transferase-like glycosyltransferase
MYYLIRKLQLNSPFWLPKVIAVFVCGLIFLGLGSAPLTDIDEGAFAEASREMLLRGDWVSPWLLDAPRYDKPVLIHWLQMISFSIFGINVWAARLPSALAGVIWIALIGLWAKLIALRFLSYERAQSVSLWAIVLAGTSIGILAISRSSTADALLNALLVASLLTLWKSFYHRTDDRFSVRGWARWSALWSGLGLLTKGPIAILIPMIGALVAAATQGKEGWIRLRVVISDAGAWLIFTSVALPWYLLQFEAQGMAFVRSFFGTHNLGRFVDTMHGFSAGYAYYPIWTGVALLPWLPVVVWVVFTLIRTGFWREKSVSMCWGIFIFVIIFFSVSATKLPHYGFYGLSGFLVIAGILLEKYATSDRKINLIITIQALFLSLLIILLSFTPLWWEHLPTRITDPYYRQVLEDAQIIIREITWWFLLPGFLALVVAFWRRIEVVMLGGFVFSATLYAGIVLPVMHAFRAPLVNAASAIRLETSEVITWRLNAPSLSFEAKRVIKPGDPGPGMVVVMHIKDHSLLVDKLRESKSQQLTVHRIWSQGGIQVVRII